MAIEVLYPCETIADKDLQANIAAATCIISGLTLNTEIVQRTLRRDIMKESVTMNTLKDIEQHISQLSLEDLAAFRVWFAEFDAQVWDRQFEEDVAAGRLNHLANKALQDLQTGRCTDL